jgi:hypothetical protein
MEVLYQLSYVGVTPHPNAETIGALPAGTGRHGNLAVDLSALLNGL